MYCKYCGKSIDNDSNFCCECGKKVVSKNETSTKHSVRDSIRQYDGQKIVRNGETLTIRNGILFDEDGWDVGMLPHGYVPGYGEPV